MATVMNAGAMPDDVLFWKYRRNIGKFMIRTYKVKFKSDRGTQVKFKNHSKHKQTRSDNGRFDKYRRNIGNFNDPMHS